MRQWIAALVFAAGTLSFAPAPRAATLPETAAEASLRVSGTIEVDRGGGVAGYTVAHDHVYPKGILDLVAQIVPGWRFEPVLHDGQPVAARAEMHLLFVARKRDDGSMAVGLRSAAFGEPGGGTIRAREKPAPHYPMDLMRENVGGTVYVLMNVDAQGRVLHVMAEQTNLRKSGTERQMAAWRRDLERAALKTLAGWSFEPIVIEDGKPTTSVRVPVAFLMPGTIGADAEQRDGRWDAYLPGPRHRAPWLTPAEYATTGYDALPDDALQQVGSGLKLLSTLDAG
jgi:hypothetical protein